MAESSHWQIRYADFENVKFVKVRPNLLLEKEMSAFLGSNNEMP